MKKAIGYTRISDDDQSRWSIQGQQNMIREHCSKNNIELTAIFTDEGESAKNFDRANWKALEEFVEKNHLQVDYLFVMAYTRFSRNTHDALNMIEQLENRYHIRIVSITEPLHMHPDAPYYHYMRTQIINNGELELRMIRDRTRFGIFNAQKAGRYITAPPVGYLRAKDSAGNPIIIIDETRAPAIRDAYRRFINGETIMSIRNILKKEGLIIKGNSAVKVMLQHPAYMGYIKRIAYYDEPEALVKGIHQAIITEDDWWKAQSIFNNKNKISQGSMSDEFPLRGVLKCYCHRNYTAAFSRGRNGMYGYYKCNTHTNINLSAKKIHAQFDEMLQEMSLPKQHILYLQNAVMKNIEAELMDRSSSSEKLGRQIAGIEKKISNLEEKYIHGDIEKEVYFKWKKIYHAEKSAFNDQLSLLRQPLDEIWRRYESSLDKLGHIQWIYNCATIEEKHGFIREVFNNQLSYQNNTYRTTFLLSLFQPKAPLLKEKGLLIYDQPSAETDNFSLSAPHRNTIEPIRRFLALIHQIKAA